MKYKAYNSKSLDVEDIRQVAAYARMKSIFKDLNLNKGSILDAIIIYPEVNSSTKNLALTDLASKIESSYYNIFRLEVDIPVINRTGI